MTEPLYRHIDFCRNAEALWGKLRSGMWDWLGVHPDGKFVLGSPARSGVIKLRAAATLTKGAAVEGEHGVREYTPEGSAGAIWCLTEEAAQQEFQRSQDAGRGEEGEGPKLLRLERVEHGEVLEVKFIVRNPSTYR